VFTNPYSMNDPRPSGREGWVCWGRFILGVEDDVGLKFAQRNPVNDNQHCLSRYRC
jgi:hypothetical protein